MINNCVSLPRWMRGVLILCYCMRWYSKQYLRMMHSASRVLCHSACVPLSNISGSGFGLSPSGRFATSPEVPSPQQSTSRYGDHTWLLGDFQPDGWEPSSLGSDLSVTWTTSCSCFQTNKNMMQPQHRATLKSRNHLMTKNSDSCQT